METKFEIGEEVVVDSYYSGFFTEKVSEITKAGNIKLKNGMIFYPGGSLRGDSSYHRTYMYKMDDKWKARIKKRELLHKIDKLAKYDNLKKLSNDKLEKIIGVLEESYNE